jgi:hypothetical protein
MADQEEAQVILEIQVILEAKVILEIQEDMLVAAVAAVAVAVV